MLKPMFLGLSRVANGLATFANAGGTLMVLGLVFIVNFDVVARGVFNSPFRGTVEVVQFAMVFIVFLQLPDVVRVNRLTRSDGFLLLITHRNPKLGEAIGRVINAVSMTLMILIAVTMWPEFVEMWHTSDYFGVPGVFTAPWWPIKLVIFLSATLCSVLFFIKVVGSSFKPKLVDLPEHEDTQ